jgi:DNA-binding NarL/FixJ family response regulator
VTRRIRVLIADDHPLLRDGLRVMLESVDDVEVVGEATTRQWEILNLIAQGRSNAEIAAALVVSLKTVRNHVSNIFNKLHVADRAQAMTLARKEGLG